MDPKVVIRRILEELGRRELARVRRMIGSKTLREAIRLVIDEGENQANLFIPHYWAVYYHDGRGSISPVSAEKLVFFANPHEDPRLPGGRSPERAGQVRRLTRRQYEEGLRINQQRREIGLPPFMFVVDRVGPAAPHPFFDRLAQGAADRADAVAVREFDRWIQELVDRGDFKGESKTATFDIP